MSNDHLRADVQLSRQVRLIVLFVAGLISMGIGVAIERVRKRYFAASTM